MYLNKAIIAGNLTRDPELKALPSGTNVTSFSLATNSVYTKDDQKVETTEYHNIVVFGKQADSCATYLKKGDQALVEGRIQTRSWEQDGQKKYRTEIVADRVQFGSKRDPKATETPAAANDTNIQYPEDEINPEDIPF